MLTSRSPLRPGPRDAVVHGPLPVPGAVRRTTSVDTVRTDLPDGPAAVTLTGRDLLVHAEGRTEVLAECTLHATVNASGTVIGLEGELPEAAVTALVGGNLRAGFGGLLAASLPEDLASRTLVGSLLEDLAGAYFVSGTVLLWTGHNRIEEIGLDHVISLQQDVCTGWRQGSQQLDHLRRNSEIAAPDGVPAPDLATSAGSDGWHDLAPLPIHSHRRARLLQVTATEDGHRLASHFRDSVTGERGEEVLHEYQVLATATVEGRVAHIDVRPQVLPWDECPGAAASAQGVVGQALADLPAHARRELRGITTCTHLNGVLRSLADADTLLRRLPAS